VDYAARNWAIERIEGGWVYFLDDDNLIHPEFEAAFHEARRLHPKAGWFIFDQVDAEGTLLRRATCPPTVGHVDLGQAVIRRDVLCGFRFREDRYDADGDLFERLAVAVPPVCVNRQATYYNALR
jgi:glycosyltransferase involved in cell wall biosynthesis